MDFSRLTILFLTFLALATPARAGMSAPPWSAPEIFIATIQEVPEGNFSNARPPSVLVKVEESLRGHILPGPLKVLWATPESGIDTGGREAEQKIWNDTKLDPPKSGSRWIICGTLGDLTLFSHTNGCLPCTPDQLTAIDRSLASTPPREFARVDFPAFLKSFNTVFEGDLEAPEVTFIQSANAPAAVLLHVKPKHDGFFIVRWDSSNPPAKGAEPHRISREFYLSIGKQNAPRWLNQSLTPSSLANVGDTVIIPIIPFTADGQFFKTSDRHRLSKNPDSKVFHDYLVKVHQSAIDEFAELPKKFPPNPNVPITNNAQPDLALLGLSLNRFPHANRGHATDSCSLLLEARRASELALSAKFDHTETTTPSPKPDTLKITIKPANQPITVFLDQSQRVETTGKVTSVSSEKFPCVRSLNAKLILRVGDRLLITPWSQSLSVDESTGLPMIAPPPFTLDAVISPSATAPAH